MSKRIYSLRILCSSNKQIEKISNLLSKNPTKEMGNIWCLELEEEDYNEYFDFINLFLNLLNGKYKQLEVIGLSKEDISVWILYEYDSQCNMEFSPNDLKRLGDSGISLCLSCWRVHSEIKLG